MDLVKITELKNLINAEINQRDRLTLEKENLEKVIKFHDEEASRYLKLLKQELK